MKSSVTSSEEFIVNLRVGNSVVYSEKVVKL